MDTKNKTEGGLNMFDVNRLKEPGYFRENRLDPHSDHECRPSYRLPLNGLWKFFHAKNPAQVVPGFEQPDFDCRGWDDIHVPAHIQLEGWGHAQYCNTEYPWDGLEDLRPGQLPESYNPVACYVQHFRLPEEMKGKRVFISFQGAESCVAVWLNGTYIGFSSDSFTPHEFELTQALREGENKLACRVYRFCAGSWLEDQDFLRFSGLYRDVYLYAIPAAHLWDLNVTAEPDGTFTKGLLQWKAKVSAPDGTVLCLRLKDGDGKEIQNSEFRIQNDKSGTNGAEEAFCSGSFTVDSPRLWSAEDPYLYDLEVVLTAPDGTAETSIQRVGFRKVEIRDSVIRINGVRVVFKGVNRHDFCGETGRAVTEEGIRRDLLLMKRNNINAVRTSHYPNTSALYRLCDELGLYVIDENNMESHGMWDMLWQGYIGKDEMFPGCLKEWEPLLLDRVRSTVGRDRNHPSIVMWSCGNESLTGTVILAMSREFKRLDPTRPVHYEGDHQVDALYPDLRLREITDVETEMYTPADRIRKYLTEHREKPFILCEYTHSMGNSNGAMHKYTEMAYEEELYQGGFIWDFIDQALVTRDRFGKETLTYGGDWDDRPTDGIFCGNGIVFADGRETPKLQEVKYNYQNIVVRPDVQNPKAMKMEVVNRHMFTPTSAFRCVAVLERDGKEIARREMETDVKPLSSAVYPLPFDAQTEPGEYAVTVSFRLREDTPWAPAGYEIAFGQGVWSIEAEKTCRRLSGELFSMSSPWNISVRGEHFSLQFSRLTGALTSYRWGNTELLKAPLMPNFWRAPINNDYGSRMPQRYAQWKIASLYASAAFDPETMKKNAEVRPVKEDDGSITFTMFYDLPTSPAASCAVTCRVHPCGKVDICLDYDPVKELGVMPEFGMITKLDADYDRVRFFGLGPDENYIDRREGARLGIWDYRAAENLTPYLLPQECGNRTGVRWAEITNAKGHGLKLWLNGGEFSALPYTPHEMENAAHGYELPPAVYTVLKMSAIQMGVGGDDSWGAQTHPEYLPDISKPLHFGFSFKGI
jgi:beta-galactosidase